MVSNPASKVWSYSFPKSSVPGENIASLANYRSLGPSEFVFPAVNGIPQKGLQAGEMVLGPGVGTLTVLPEDPRFVPSTHIG